MTLRIVSNIAIRNLLSALVAIAGLACGARQGPPPASAPPRARPFSSAPAAGTPAGTPEDQDGDGRPDAWVVRSPDGAVTLKR